jgi:hypothetical protein
MGLKVEPVVVASDEDQELKRQDPEGCAEPQSARGEDQERQHKFDDEHGAGG